MQQEGEEGEEQGEQEEQQQGGGGEEDDLPRCSKKKSCPNVGIACALRGCQKLICMGCYHNVLQRKKIDLTEALPNNEVACTLGCHKKASKVAAADPSRISWDDDTPDGKYEGSSEALLLDWLKTPGNYAKWRGNNRGITKGAIQHIRLPLPLLPGELR